MNRISALFASIAMVAMGLLASAPAEALNSKSFVSSVGAGGNDCVSIATAAARFRGCTPQTFDGGQITCVDSLDFLLPADNRRPGYGVRPAGGGPP